MKRLKDFWRRLNKFLEEMWNYFDIDSAANEPCPNCGKPMRYWGSSSVSSIFKCPSCTAYITKRR